MGGILRDLNPGPATPVDLREKPGRAAKIQVALVRGPVVVLPGSLATHGPTPPIGLAYLASALRDAGHRVTLIDAPGEAIESSEMVDSPIGKVERIGLSAEEVIDRIPPSTRLIGFTLMFLHEWPQMRELIDAVRKARPEAFIVVGGETATSFWPWMLEQTDSIDLIATGEGEATVATIAETLAAGEIPAGLEGTVAPDRGNPSTPATDNGLPTRLRALRDIPTPAWDLVRLDAYWENPFFGVDRGRSMPMLATRGCPHKCSFCSSPQMWTTRYVVRPVEDVVDEIEEYVRKHDVSNINFCDLTAIVRRKWTLEFCDELASRDLGITWQLPVGTRAEALDAEVLRKLRDTGCSNITYAPESGSPRMLEVYDKKVDLGHILESVGEAHRLGLKTHVNIILGHPAERWKDVLLSVRFLWRAARVGCEDAAVILFCPYPGSADFEALREAGSIEVDESTCYIALARSSAAARSFNPRFGPRLLRLMQLAMLGFFYTSTMALHPKRLVSFVRSRFTGDESTYLEQMLRTRRQLKDRRRARGVTTVPITSETGR